MFATGCQNFASKIKCCFAYIYSLFWGLLIRLLFYLFAAVICVFIYLSVRLRSWMFCCNQLKAWAARSPKPGAQSPSWGWRERLQAGDICCRQTLKKQTLAGDTPILAACTNPVVPKCPPQLLSLSPPTPLPVPASTPLQQSAYTASVPKWLVSQCRLVPSLSDLLVSAGWFRP